MAARWASLTEFLRGRDSDVVLTWSELDAIVGGMPDSAQNHFPQWWHGDRPNTRAWRAAGYEATDIRPGASVRFVRKRASIDISPPIARAVTIRPPSPSPSRTARDADGGGLSAASALEGVDRRSCLVVIPCSKSKRRGGVPGQPTGADPELESARRAVLGRSDSAADESWVMPAWRRYSGRLYGAAGSAIETLALEDRLLILSGGYGVLSGQDMIGDYDRRMKASDWPRGVLERALSHAAAASGRDIVIFAAATTDYAHVVRRTVWCVPHDRSVHLLSTSGLRGTGAVTGALGRALRTLILGDGQYPDGVVVDRLDQ